MNRSALCAVLLTAAGLWAAQGITEITLPGTRVFPESITSTNDGTLFVGSLGHGNVRRIAPGKSEVEEWIKPGTSGLNSVLGVYADEKGRTLWICSTKMEDKGEPSALKAFDLKTAALKGSYTLPGEKSFCNDIAVSSDGTAYIADTRQAMILMLKKGGTALEVAAKDPLLAGADGLAFGDKTVLIVNSVSAGKLLRLILGADGKSTSVVDLKLSRPLGRPDGLRAIGKNRFLMAENAGIMSVVTIDGDTATMTNLKEGMAATPAVTATRGMAWVVEGKLNYLNDPKMKDQDPGTFKLFAVLLPKK